jgi:hypothetical protein
MSATVPTSSSSSKPSTIKNGIIVDLEDLVIDYVVIDPFRFLCYPTHPISIIVVSMLSVFDRGAIPDHGHQLYHAVIHLLSNWFLIMPFKGVGEKEDQFILAMVDSLIGT